MIIQAKDILPPLVKDLEEKGITTKQYYFDLSRPDGEYFKALQVVFPDATEDAIYKSIQEAKANVYLEYYSIGGEREKLRMTTKGFQAGKALLQNQKRRASRSKVKIVSDWVNEHNGLTTGYAAIVSTLV